MHLLLKKSTVFNWTGECQIAFDRLKAALTEAPCLIYPDFALLFILCIDASCDGLGAVLEQIPEGSQHPQPVQYASVSFSKAQKNYSITELECLAVVWAMGKLRHYLMVQEFQIITEHITLKYILQDKGNIQTGRLARWKLLLQEFTFQVEYRPGRHMSVPDALSRNPQTAEAEPPYDESQEMLAMASAANDPEADLASLVD